MRRSRLSYLERRPAGFFFRYQFPSRLRAIAGRSCLRACLRTRDRATALERVATVLPHLHSLKRLGRKGHNMTSDEYRRALSFAVKRVVATLESWDEPWRDDRERIPEYLEWKLLKQSFAEWPDVRPALTLALDNDMRRRVAGEGLGARSEAPKESLGSILARTVLNALGIVEAEDSDLFSQLRVDMEKLQLGVLQVMQARSNGDPSAEDKFKAYFRRLGYLPSAQQSAAASTPTLSEAWREFSSEKMSGPKPASATSPH